MPKLAGSPPSRTGEGLGVGASRPAERCELCAAALAERHGHLVNLQTRTLACACRPCALLFEHAGAAQGTYRATPERYLYDPAFALSEDRWDALQIPVSLAFFFLNSALGRVVAIYPGPAGAVESALPLDAWDGVLATNPAFADLVSDVEALLVHRPSHRPSHHPDTSEPFAGFLVPIDACYELVGRVRRSWQGFDGGPEAWREIEAFFAGLRARSETVRR